MVGNHNHIFQLQTTIETCLFPCQSDYKLNSLGTGSARVGKTQKVIISFSEVHTHGHKNDTLMFNCRIWSLLANPVSYH